MTDYQAMRPWASLRQLEVLAAMEKHGSQAKAAKALGISTTAVEKSLGRLSRAAARAGHSPEHDMTKTTAPGFHIKGESTLYDADGKVRLQWVKTQIDENVKLASLLDAIQTAVEDVPKVEPVAAPEASRDDYLCVYPMGDPHVGMFSWPEETGAAFDLHIAEAQIERAFAHLCGLAPEGTDALLIDLGDFFHSDSQANVTRKSGHQLDVDSRYLKIIRVGVRIMYNGIDQLLTKHRTVRVRCEIGNHDDQSAMMLALALEQRYLNEPRVVVETSAAKFWYHEFGRCLLGTTHLDTVKPQQLPGIMAVDQAEAWGRTLHRRWYTGHEHHERVKEYPGCVVETFRTLAPRDAWHAGQGYRSEQDMRLDIWHRDHGIVNRHIVGIGQLR